MAGDRERALAAGCDDYDTKPVDLPRLLRKIDALAGARRLAQDRAAPGDADGRRAHAGGRARPRSTRRGGRAGFPPPACATTCGRRSTTSSATASCCWRAPAGAGRPRAGDAGARPPAHRRRRADAGGAGRPPLGAPQAGDESGPADLAQLCHDLRTPLTPVIGYGELLQEEAEERRLPSPPPTPRASAGPAGACWVWWTPPSGWRRPGPPATRRARLPGPGEQRRCGRAAGGAARASAGRGQRAGGPAGLTGTVLVVDDDEPGRDLLARRLARSGHTARPPPARAAAGPRAPGSRRVDVVLLDVMMPGLDGYQVLAAAGRPGPAPRPGPVPAADDEAGAGRLALGAEDYLPKPLDAVLLRARLGACLERKRLRDREARHLPSRRRSPPGPGSRRARGAGGAGRAPGRLKSFFSPQLAEAIAAGGTRTCSRPTGARSRSSSSTCAASPTSPRPPSPRK